MTVRDLATIEAALRASEAKVPDLRPGCEKRIIWAGDPARATDISVLFIHGFSASPEEIRPLPDMVAKALGANLHFTRLTGHGQDGAAMGRATLAAWQADVAEALEIAATIGKRVIVIGCSTGCTLATLALAQGARAHAMVHVSPNFGLTHRLAQVLLDLPWSRHWSHLIAGRERRFPTISAAHAAYWTPRYPTKAVHVMADAVRAALAADLGQIGTPALFCYNETDQVVSARRTRKVMARWGAPVADYRFQQGPDDDAMGHLMAGDIFSPRQTGPAVTRILAWLDALPGD
ncbi:alpha/beta hydrolase [Yoonia sp.]|uniref:alpha/beta hydrolase n=1 Tax=Yoonia sp. TaxID=2212373 RepID=UPI002FDA60D7